MFTGFDTRLDKIIENAGFWKLFFIRFLWNFRSTRFVVFVLATIFFCLGMIDSWVWLTACGIYVGMKTIEKFGGF